MRRRSWILVPLLLVLVTGCAVAASRRDDNPPRVRCLLEPGAGPREQRDRPLLFFLCIEAP